MREMFEQFVIRFCFAGLGATALIALVLATYPTVDERIGKPLGRAVRSRRISVLLPIICVCGTILFAMGKGLAPANETAPRAQVRMIAPSLSISPAEGAAMAEADEGMSLIGHWFRSGAHDIEYPVSFDDGWVFPYGSNHLSRIEIWACGKVCAVGDNPVPIAEISEDLSCRPQVTRVYCGFTPDGAFRVEWRDAYANNDLNQPMNASIDLHRDGRITITENGVTRTIRRKLPFAHDGFGQDDDWVRANFANAEEIISTGYANWVDAQVSLGLTNGLYKFTASFEDAPLEATEFHIGDYSVCVTNAGEYVFLLEKGTDYEFGTWPYNEDVDYWAQDDLSNDAPVQVSSWGGWKSPGEWSVDGGWNWLYYPRRDNLGYCNWMPTLQGSPNVPHLGPNDFPATFAAILTDYCGNATPAFHWSASDENLQFDSPNARTTTVSCASLPSWGALSMSVQADLGGHSLWSYLYPTYGTNEMPQVALALKVPEVVFLNDDQRGDRYYRVNVRIESDVATNGHARLVHVGETEPTFYSDNGDTSIALVDGDSDVQGLDVPYEFSAYFACAKCGEGSFRLECETADGKITVAEKGYRVIEPLCSLVCTEMDATYASHINPSKLLVGQESTFRGGLGGGEFAASNVQWSVIGPVVAMTNDWELTVVPTSHCETVVACAQFNEDAAQPMFALPVVQKRRIPIRGFIVAAPDEVSVDASVVNIMIQWANVVYRQVGVEFYVTNVVSGVGTSALWNLNMTRWEGTGEERRLVYTDEARGLLNTYAGNDCIEVYVVGKIFDADSSGGVRPAAVWTPLGVVVGAEDKWTALAHALGHALGLADCYISSGDMELPLLNEPVSATDFQNPDLDFWGGVGGHGFYRREETRGIVFQRLLMFGYTYGGGSDIPASSVRAFSVGDAGMSSFTTIPLT